MKITSNAHSKNMELTLETWVGIIKVLGYKIKQASLLAYPDLVILKLWDAFRHSKRNIQISIKYSHLYLSKKSLDVLAATFNESASQNED